MWIWVSISNDQSAHAVDILLLQCAQLAGEAQLDVKVKVAVVARVGFHSEHAVNFLVPLDRQVVVQVENGLFPVRVGGVRRRTEAHPLVAFREFDCEKAD